MNIHILASLKTATAKTNLAARLTRKISLNYIAVYRIRNIARQLHDIFSLLLYRLRNGKHIAYLLEHTVQLVVEIFVVIDYPEMRMTLPSDRWRYPSCHGRRR